MGMWDSLNKKLSQATCDKIEMNKKVLRIRKSLKEVEKTIGSESKTKKEK